MNPKKELLWGLWVDLITSGVELSGGWGAAA